MGKFNLKDLLGGTLEGIISSIGKALDDNITNKEERLAAQKEIAEVLLNHEAGLDDEVTERLRIDMASDSWLSKNVRPIMFMSTFFIVTFITLFDGNVGNFSVETAYLPLWEGAFNTILIAYVGSRGAEKIFKTINRNKK